MSTLTENLLIVTIMLGYACMEWATRRYKATVHASADDNKLELLIFLSTIAIIQPTLILLTREIGLWLVPDKEGVLANLPWWAMFGILLLGDDLTQYWWHRISHSRIMWPLHRAHHTATYMSIRMAYRNNIFYYMLMPGLWVAGVALYLGFGAMYAYYLLLKLVVVLGAHSAWRWDEPLYRIRALKPVMWLVQRVISTPATHWAHHALSQDDGIGHYKGNYGNMLFFWDVLFGTAHITQQYPPAIGLLGDRVHGPERWFYEMFYPVLQSRREHSALRFGGVEYADEETRGNAPTPS